MIYQIIGSDNAKTTEDYVRDWAPRLKGAIHVIFIEELFKLKRLPVGSFLFCDIERLDKEHRELLAQVYEQLESFGPPMRLFNHPLKAKNRLELLDAMYRAGVNPYRAFPAANVPADLRFPAFIRVGQDHHGARTEPLSSWGELEQKLIAALMSGWALDRLLVIEYCDTADGTGTFAKYNAYRVGDRIVPRGVTFGQEWQLKGRDASAVWRADLKWEYVRSNPYAGQLMNVFQLANIEFGRIDYSVKDGKIVVWEINTAPVFSNGPPSEQSEERREIHQFTADGLAGALEKISQLTSELRVEIGLSWPPFRGRS